MCSVLTTFETNSLKMFRLCFSAAENPPGLPNEGKWKATALNVVIKSDVGKRVNLI